MKTLETKEGKQFLPQTFGGVKKLQHFNEFSLLVLAPGIKRKFFLSPNFHFFVVGVIFFGVDNLR